MHHAFQFRTLAAALCLLALPVLSVQAAEEAAAPPNEDALIAALQADGDYMTHLAAFRGLRQVGTEKSIPVVTGFLHDAKKSHLARYVLEGMPGDAASKALRNSLAGATPEVTAGLVSSIGVRRDLEALALLTPLINHEDAQVAR